MVEQIGESLVCFGFVYGRVGRTVDDDVDAVGLDEIKHSLTVGDVEFFSVSKKKRATVFIFRCKRLDFVAYLPSSAGDEYLVHCI